MRTGFVAAILALLGSVTAARAQPPAAPPAAPPTPALGVALPPPPSPTELTQPPSPAAEHAFDLGRALMETRFRVSGAYLHWWVSQNPLPPLITRGSASDPVPGAVGQPGTRVLFGGDYRPVEDEARSGGRFNFGVGLTSDYFFALEADFLYLPSDARHSSPVAAPGQVIARPFIDANTGAETTAVVASPDLVGGGVVGKFGNNLFGAEANFRAGLYRDTMWDWSLVAGLRYLSFDEDLEIGELVPVLAGVPVFAQDQLAVVDRFDTRNTFFGGQIGLQCECKCDRLVLGMRAKVALGTSRETVTIRGLTVPANTAGPAASPPPIASGILALPTNSGTFQRNQFTAVPEFGVSIGYYICDWLRVDVGYTLIYWDSVARAADQIDRTLNTTQIPSASGIGVLTGPARPAFLFRESELWLQGLNVTFEVRF